MGDALKQENAQLKTELQAQKAVIRKLKIEKDEIYEALVDAQEENRLDLQRCLLARCIALL